MYVGTKGHGFFRLDDPTQSWVEANDGLPVGQYVDVHEFLTLEATLYAATSHGVYRLPPDSKRWEPRNGGLAGEYITALAASDDWTFAGAWDGGIFRSPDRGGTWEQVYGTPVSSEDIAVAR